MTEDQDWDNIPEIVQDASLPQYMYSQELLKRFYDAAHYEGVPISITPRERGYLTATKESCVLDNFNWFSQNAKRFQDEFRKQLIEYIGEDKTENFLRLISECWSDGKSKREKHDIAPLLNSIRKYLYQKYGSIVATSKLLQGDGMVLLTESELEAILWVNESMLQWVIDDWITQRLDLSDIGRQAVHASRGIVTKEPLSEKLGFNGLITAYSLAFSVAEQFGTPHADWKGATTETHSSLIHTEIDTFSKRTLFFSPFIHGMPSEQFELGVIPGHQPDRLEFQKKRGLFSEYFLHPSDLSP